MQPTDIEAFLTAVNERRNRAHWHECSCDKCRRERLRRFLEVMGNESRIEGFFLTRMIRKASASSRNPRHSLDLDCCRLD